MCTVKVKGVHAGFAGLGGSEKIFVAIGGRRSGVERVKEAHYLASFRGV